MISNKALSKLILVVLVIIPITSASINNIPNTSHSTLSRKQKSASKQKGKITPTLKDTSSEVEDVQAGDETTIDVNSIQKRVPLVNEQFKKLMDQGRYDEIVQLGDTMSKCEYSIHACLLVKTIDQYNSIVKHPKRCTMIPAFFVYGDINVVNEAIAAESRFYGDEYTNLRNDRNLRFAVMIAFKIDRHDRIIDLLEIRRIVTAEKGKWPEGKVRYTSFGTFLGNVFFVLPLEKEIMPLKRFLTFRECEFRNRNPDLYDDFCQILISYLKRSRLDKNVEEFLVDLVGQHSLLTIKIFVNGFFVASHPNSGDAWINFVKFGWAEATEEGLKEKYEWGGRKLWEVMTEKFPGRFSGDFPDTDELRKAVSEKFSTKKQLEERWIKENAPNFFRQLEEFIINIFPSVLVKLIFDYAEPHPTLLDDQRIKTPQNKFIDVSDH